MAKALVVVESPAKAKTINKYLGKDFKVMASMGHIRDLPKSKLGVAVDEGFEPVYEAIPARKKVIKALRVAAKDVSHVYVATDPDREGEAIGWHLANELRTKKRKISRLMFNEITRTAVLAALDQPVEIDQRMVDAQQARRVLDRLMGYKLSPLLWDKVRRGLSAGRVQSVALKLVCDRESEIEAFKPEEYWNITARLAGAIPPEFEARLAKKGSAVLKVRSDAEAKAVLADLDKAAYLVRSVVTKERKKHAAPPFITSKLQQASKFSVKRTMIIAQQLYEGIELPGDGSVGLITYMRTDSTRVSEQALSQVRDHITQAFGPDYLPAKPNRYKTKKDAQDAHEAIRPTSMDRDPESVRAHVTAEQYYLYRLIWHRFTASQMPPATFDDTTVDIAAGEYVLRAKGSVPKFSGWLAVYEDHMMADDGSGSGPSTAAGNGDAEAVPALLPPLVEGDRLRSESAQARPEVHTAAAQVQRGDPRQGARGERDWAPQYLCRDHRRAHDAGVRRQDRGALQADDVRPVGDRSSVGRLCRHHSGGVHAGNGGPPRSHRRGKSRLPGDDQQLLREVQDGSRRRGRVDAEHQDRGAPERRDLRKV